MNRVLKIIVIVIAFSLVGLAVPLIGCSEPESEMSEDQIVTVQRGNLVIDITAVGNLALSCTEDLAFEIAGTVEEVLVEEADSVEEGQVLATLDTSEWEEQLSALEDRVTAAERQVTAKERDRLQAEINIKNAAIALDKAEDSWLDTVTAGEAVKRAKDYLEYLQYEYSVGTTPAEIEAWQLNIYYANQSLEQAWGRFLGVASVSEEVIVKEMGVELAQARLEDAQIAIEDAQKSLEDAREALEEDKEASPEITAPFDGFITRVNVDGGDEVKKGTVAAVIADPAKFEADILVSEMDILQVKPEGETWVQVDAMQGLSLPAKVAHISPTATIQSGVVNYKVKVEIQSLEAIMREREGAMPGSMPGTIPGRARAGCG